MTLKSTKEDWVSDIQEHLRTIAGESFRPLPSLYHLSKPDAMKLESILSQVIYNNKRWTQMYEYNKQLQAEIQAALDNKVTISVIGLRANMQEILNKERK